MPDLYARIGQLVMKAVAEQLAKIPSIKVPHVGRCTIDNVEPPGIHAGNWSFNFDVKFPKSSSQLTLCVFTSGSCLLDDVERLKLPPPDFEDDLEKEFPKEHQEAWVALREALYKELKSLGLKAGSTKGSDYLLVDDYYPSRGISGSLHKPKIVTSKLAARCQELLKKHGGWDFWIQFDLYFKDRRYKGKHEHLLIREDRIVLDANIARLEREFPGEFAWDR
jgi:hypothetical protein